MLHNIRPRQKGFFDAFDEILGWYGTIAILGAYLANSFGFMNARSLPYQLLNATGSLGIIAISFRKKAWQPVVLNIVWLAIGVVAILRIYV